MTVGHAPNVDDLNEIVEQVWSSYLDPEGVNPLLPVETEPAEGDVHSLVSITGSWHGHVVFASSTAAARHAAAAFLAMDADEVSHEDVSDVLGELANIIGGNVKSMLPPGCFVSLPQVVMAPDSATRYPSAVQVCGLFGRWLDEPVSITMWQSKNEVRKEETS
jgi:chemotaxis protein CheX